MERSLDPPIPASCDPSIVSSPDLRLNAAVATEHLHPLADDRALLGRTSTAERVADILRSRIAEGFFPPGTRLSEDSIGGALGVSRNTLRESFRLLTHERLLEHRLNRGVFVRVLSVDDVEDIYRTRRLIECAVVRSLGAPPHDLHRVADAVAEGQRGAREGDWRVVATANIHFHQELVALAGSERTDEVMRSVLAELRLAFHVVADPIALHEPYLVRNQEIVDALVEGRFDAAETLLADYLDDSLDRIVAAYAQHVPAGE